MKAKPLKRENNEWIKCSAENATHIELRIPSPIRSVTLPVQLKGTRGGTKNWTWNGDTEQPTLKPSVLNRTYCDDSVDIVCHSFITDGKVQFLNDCTHANKGKTLELEDVI